MRTIIDAECILANLLLKHESVTIRDLNRARAAVEQAVASVYVDITTNCLVWAANRRPDMFAWEDDVFRRVREWSSTSLDDFNSRIPAEVRPDVLDVLSNMSV